jgi:hypothetical protein
MLIRPIAIVWKPFSGSNLQNRKPAMVNKIPLKIVPLYCVQ